MFVNVCEFIVIICTLLLFCCVTVLLLTLLNGELASSFYMVTQFVSCFAELFALYYSGAAFLTLFSACEVIGHFDRFYLLSYMFCRLFYGLGDMWTKKDDDDDEPDWIKEERNQFMNYRDKNKDGVMDREEVKAWIIPDDYDHADSEAKHLIHEADKNQVGNILLL